LLAGMKQTTSAEALGTLMRHAAQPLESHRDFSAADNLLHEAGDWGIRLPLVRG
jgi:hypothetical protein